MQISCTPYNMHTFSILLSILGLWASFYGIILCKKGHFLVQSWSFKRICRNNTKSWKMCIKMNKFLIVVFYHFQLKQFLTKLFVIIAPNNSLELALTLFCRTCCKRKRVRHYHKLIFRGYVAKILTLEFELLKLNLRDNLFIFIEISNGGNVI